MLRIYPKLESMKCLTFVFTCLFSFIFVNIPVCYTINIRTFDTFLNDKVNTTLHKITVNYEKNFIYVGAVNYLKSLDGNLNSKSPQLTTGPYSGEDNVVKVLAFNKEDGYVLFCGSIKNGLCSVHSPIDLKTLPQGTMKVNNNLNLLGGKKDVIAFFGEHKHEFLNKSVLYVAQSYDKRPLSMSPRVLSSRYVQYSPENTKNKYSLQYLVDNSREGIKSGIDLDPVVKPTFDIRYVYGFEYEGFTYYLKVQPTMIATPEYYTTRLARTCQNDPGYYSYTEIELNCMSNNNLFIRNSGSQLYNMAQAAYLGEIGVEFAERFSMSPEEKVLYVAFWKSYDQSAEIDKSKGSIVCLYSMTKIKTAFTEVQKECYRGTGRILAWINEKTPSCERQVSMHVLRYKNIGFGNLSIVHIFHTLRVAKPVV